ncbi:MAG: DUF167 domain-containing protein [Candidatus Nanopelagicales bacterium]
MRATIRVKPGASRVRVGGGLPPEREGELPVLLVAVTAQAVDGKATAAAERALAGALALRPNQVAVVRGASSRTKTVEITGCPDLAVRWAALCAN